RAVFFGTDPRAEVGWRYGPHMNAFMRLAMAPLISGTPLVVNSQALAARFRRYHPRVIQGGVDTRRFDQLSSKAAARRSLGIPEGRTLLVTVGKVIPVNGLEWLMEIVRDPARGYVRESRESEACQRVLLEQYEGQIAGEQGRRAQVQEPGGPSSNHRDVATSAEHKSTYSTIPRSTENRSTAMRRAPSR